LVALQIVARMAKLGAAMMMGAACLAALWLTLKFLVWEPTGLPRGSLIYTFKVPAAAKELRLWGVSDTPLFDVRHGDGPAPGYTLIHYATQGGTEKLKHEIAADGFQCDRLEPGSISCERRKDGALEVHVLARYEFTTDSSQVTVHVPQY
jgi:hypothetical protein